MIVQVKSNVQGALAQSPKSAKKSKSRISKAQRIRRKTVKVLRGQTENFDLINPHAAGIDIGSEQMFVAVPADRDPEPVRMFQTSTLEF